ncbi:sterol desaturase family protein [Clostridium sp. DJ247]|uniref:sterol desaturase family protein n=1 Tax=Clostridium sp. DJ247 TaxID=2726188 RepID=UPI001629EFBF|nr:sterol desaturase family protein [Clostridium sp. DJ247]MBC2581935.1 hypothetical protein [Clostridium sp. DJ247]
MLLLLTIIFSLLYSSLVEYCIHRFLLHRSYKQSHIKDHHRIFHGIKSYEFNEPNPEDIISSKKDILITVAFSLPIVLIIFIQNKLFAVLFLLTSFVYNLWGEYVHFCFHRTNNNILDKFTFFKKLKEHHRVHHYNYNTNYGIASRFWDIVFGTKK